MALDWPSCWTACRAGAWSPTCPTTWPPRWSPTCSTGCRRSTRMLVMVQREVGERLVAAPGDDGLRRGVGQGRLLGGRVELVGRVPASVFLPRPGSNRCWSDLERRPPPAVDPALVSYGRLFAVVRAGFAQRRKMLRRALAGVVEPAAFERAGVRPDARAEELDVADWGRLAAL